MAKKIIPILILLIGCSSPSIEHPVTQTPPIIQFDRGRQTTELCKEYLGSNRNNRTLLKTSYYLANGIIASEYHHINSTWTTEGKQIYYDYQDTLLVQKRSYLDNGDSTKTIYYYDDERLLLKEEHYDFEKRIRKDVDKGFTGSEGCVVWEDDFEKDRTWKIRSVIHYKYDSLGRQTEYYAPTIHWGSQNRYTWTYDNNNKVLEHKSYDHDRLIWTQEYTYSMDSYEMTRTCFDHDGYPRHLKANDEYTPKLTFQYTLNKAEQVINEVVINEKGEPRSRETTEYDEKGRVVESTKFNADKQIVKQNFFQYEPHLPTVDTEHAQSELLESNVQIH